MSDKTEKKYMKKSEIVTFGIGLFGVALMTGWMPDYTATFFADFAFKGKGFELRHHGKRHLYGVLGGRYHRRRVRAGDRLFGG